MFATTFALLNTSYSGKDRGIAYGVWGAIGGAAAAIGPVLGGLLTEGLSWEWIFFVNLPISVAAIAMTLSVFGADEPDHTRRPDVWGTVTFTAFAATLTFALIRANDDGWGSTTVVSLFVVSAVALAAFVISQRLGRHAMLDLALLRNRSFVGVLLAALAVNAAAFSALAYASIWLQSVLRLSPIEAGLTGLPLSAAAFVVSASIGRKLHSVRPGPIIGGGLLLIGAGSILDGLLIDGSSSWAALIPGYVITGLGVGFALPTLSSTAMAAVPLSRGGMAAGAVNTARQLSFAVGIAVLGTVFASRAQTYLAGHGAPDPVEAARGVSGGQAQRILAAVPQSQRPRIDAALHGAAAAGLDGAMIGAGLVGVVAGLIALVLIRPAKIPAPAQTAEAPDSAKPSEPVIA